MHEQPAEVLAVLFDAVIMGFDVFLFEETQDRFFQLSAPLARDDLHQPDLFIDRILYGIVQCGIDLSAVAETFMKVDHNFCHSGIIELENWNAEG